MKPVKKLTPASVTRLESDANKLWVIRQQIAKMRQQQENLIHENQWLYAGIIDASGLTDDYRNRLIDAAKSFPKEQGPYHDQA